MAMAAACSGLIPKRHLTAQLELEKLRQRWRASESAGLDVRLSEKLQDACRAHGVSLETDKLLLQAWARGAVDFWEGKRLVDIAPRLVKEPWRFLAALSGEDVTFDELISYLRLES